MNIEKKIWSVGGGKGGVGKSVTAANIGAALAQRGKKVILVDADLGGANLHIYFGIKQPPHSLEDFIKGRSKNLEEVAIATAIPGLRLISGASEFLGIANPAHAQKLKLINHIKKLNADHILVDLGAGSTYNILDFFSLSNEGIIVLVPEPAAIQNAYIFLKSFVYRRLDRLFSANTVISALIKEATETRGEQSVKTFADLCEKIAKEDAPSAEAALAEIKSFKPKLLLNMAMSKDDLGVVEAFKNAAKTFLSIDTQFIGTLYSRSAIKSAARKMQVFMLDESARDAQRDMEVIITALLSGAEVPIAKEAPADTAKAAMDKKPTAEAKHDFGFNENVSHEGRVFHVQTEVLWGVEPVIETIIYCAGRILFSKKSRRSEMTSQPEEVVGTKELASKQHRIAIAGIKMNKLVLRGLEK
jgi:flagellar biosynthesis protein FlhG